MQTIPLCNTSDLADGGDAMPFDVAYQGETCRAFAIRYNGQAHAYLNRCTHVPMELDYQPNRIFDDSGEWLLCATHGAAYRPDTGDCGGGPCRGGLVKIELSESESVVRWHTRDQLQAVDF